jgi:hypothetical protein
MNKIKHIMSIVLLGLLLSSCHTTTHTTRKSTFSPDVIELRINMSDLKLLGETEISVLYSRYLGMFTVVHEVNGAPYDPTEKITTRIEGINFGLNSPLYKATHKVVNEHSEAYYYQLVYKRTVVDRLFLGKEIKKTALIRAYSLNKKTSSE